MKKLLAVFSLPASGGNRFLQILLGFSMVYYLALMMDLVIQPMSLGLDFEGTLSDADRWIEALAGTGVIIIGIFIVRRVPGNPIGPLIMIYGVGTAGWMTPQVMGSPLFSSASHLFFDFYSTGVTFTAGIVLLLFFPTGQLFPRWVKPWIVLYITITAIVVLLGLMAEAPGGHDLLGGGDLPINPIFVPALAPYYDLLNNTIGSAFSILGLFGAAIALIFRYRVGQAREKVQIRWLIWVMGIALALLLVDVIPGSLIPTQTLNSPFVLICLIVFYAFLGTAPAVGIGLAILRSHLWDIDIIIRKTLLYSGLTAILALIYFGGVISLQQLFRGITGQNSNLAVILTTLAIAALFTPLRKRLQNGIDRRFYRQKYDAAQTLALFERTARDEVDIARLSEALQRAVEETLQPETVRLWLKEIK